MKKLGSDIELKRRPESFQQKLAIETWTPCDGVGCPVADGDLMVTVLYRNGRRWPYPLRARTQRWTHATVHDLPGKESVDIIGFQVAA